MKDWESLRYFLAVAKAGSVSLAADRMNVNQSTVSRRINRFEEELNVRLFDRLSSGYQLTEEGTSLYNLAIQVESQIGHAELELTGRNQELSGVIRVTVPTTLAPLLLTPLFLEFHEAYPDIELQIIASNDLHNISQRESDVAFRVSSAPPPDHLVSRELGSIYFSVYCSQNYLAEYTNEGGNSPLRWIGEDDESPRPSWLSERYSSLHVALRANEPMITLAAVIAGVGVGRLPRLAANAHPDLVEFAAGVDIPTKALRVVTHPGLRKTKRLRVFLDFMSDRIRTALINKQ